MFQSRTISRHGSLLVITSIVLLFSANVQALILIDSFEIGVVNISSTGNSAAATQVTSLIDPTLPPSTRTISVNRVTGNGNSGSASAQSNPPTGVLTLASSSGGSTNNYALSVSYAMSSTLDASGATDLYLDITAFTQTNPTTLTVTITSNGTNGIQSHPVAVLPTSAALLQFQLDDFENNGVELDAISSISVGFTTLLQSSFTLDFLSFGLESDDDGPVGPQGPDNPVDPNPVIPEPTSAALLGLAGLALLKRRRLIN